MRLFASLISIIVAIITVLFFAMMAIKVVFVVGQAVYCTHTILTMPSVVVDNTDACDVGFRTTFMSEMATSAVHLDAALATVNIRIHESGTDVRLLRQLSALVRTQRRVLPCQLEPVYIIWEIMTNGVSIPA
jgi:hypothetical protein